MNPIQIIIQTVKINQLGIRQVSKSASDADQSHLCIIAELGYVARDGVVLFFGDSAHSNEGNSLTKFVSAHPKIQLYSPS